MVPRHVEYIVGTAFLYHFPGVHHRDLVCQFAHDCKVVADVDSRHTRGTAKLPDRVEDVQQL